MKEEQTDRSGSKLFAAGNNRPLLVVIVLLLLVIIWLLIKLPIPWLPKPPLHDGPPKPKMMDRIRSLAGVVESYRSNPHLDINAIQIKTSPAGVKTFDFRPHMAKAITQTAQIGDSVTVTYAMHPNDEEVGYQLIAIKNNITGKSDLLKDIPPPPDVPNHNTEQFKLSSPVVLTDKYGGIVALRKNNLLFHFKPGLVDNISSLIKQSKQFDLIAVHRLDDQGFINVNHDKVYIVLSISIDNKTYLVR
ncbi:hypothetical protein INP83_14220 [Mucilaginibacter sp. 21P]|uniref:hypothetical protein n=1 Tax=Mucilaginibacter sp. 21P TaxID=2778902 RepID=UPI001C5792F5|nr:hypothetical protein [Mucilaginibacter sp. 21P]QXV64244.1 hypothetical protein INP83_14220 [Mucilaginibacter sp. 21P]